MRPRKIGDIPKQCPECDTSFPTIRAPRKQMTAAATSLYWMGIIITCIWAPVLCIGAGAFFANSPVVVIPANPMSAATWGVVAIAILLAPGLLLGGMAMAMAKVIRRQCRKCKWARSYEVDRRGNVLAIYEG